MRDSITPFLSLNPPPQPPLQSGCAILLCPEQRNTSPTRTFVATHLSPPHSATRSRPWDDADIGASVAIHLPSTPTLAATRCPAKTT